MYQTLLGLYRAGLSVDGVGRQCVLQACSPENYNLTQPTVSLSCHSQLAQTKAAVGVFKKVSWHWPACM